MRLAFADSEVAGVEVDGAHLRVRFAAAVVQATAPGDEGGYLLGPALELEGALWRGEPARCFGRLRAGELADATTRFVAVDLPFGGPGPWQAAFEFANGERLHVTAQRAAIADCEPGRLRPSYDC